MNKIQFLNTSYLPASIEEQLFLSQLNYEENRIDKMTCSPTPTFMDQVDFEFSPQNLEIEVEENSNYSYAEEYDPLELYMQELYQQISTISIQQVDQLPHNQSQQTTNPYIKPTSIEEPNAAPVLQKRLVSFGLQCIQEKDEDLQIVDSEEYESDSEESEEID